MAGLINKVKGVLYNEGESGDPQTGTNLGHEHGSQSSDSVAHGNTTSPTNSGVLLSTKPGIHGARDSGVSASPLSNQELTGGVRGANTSSVPHNSSTSSTNPGVLHSTKPGIHGGRDAGTGGSGLSNSALMHDTGAGSGLTGTGTGSSHDHTNRDTGTGLGHGSTTDNTGLTGADTTSGSRYDSNTSGTGPTSGGIGGTGSGITGNNSGVRGNNTGGTSLVDKAARHLGSGGGDSHLGSDRSESHIGGTGSGTTGENSGVGGNTTGETGLMGMAKGSLGGSGSGGDSNLGSGHHSKPHDDVDTLRKGRDKLHGGPHVTRAANKLDPEVEE